MPTAKFKCKRCKRSFGMAAHLARHMSTIHASKKRKTSNAKTTKKKAKRRTAEPMVVRTVAASRAKIGPIRAFLTCVSGSEGIIDVMQAHHSELLAQRHSLDAQIDAYARAMKTIGAATPTGSTPRAGKKRGRPVEAVGRPGSLKNYIVRVLRQSSKPMSLQDIGTRVKKAGFKTRAKDLTGAVSSTLPALKSVKRVGYGKYQLTGQEDYFVD